MNKNAKRWVRALRSGKYNQGVGALHQRDAGGSRLCCLGVACDLFAKSGGKLKISYSRQFDGTSKVHYDDKFLTLPESVKDWLGLDTDTGGYLTPRNLLTCLVDKNDEGSSFKQIALVIEKEPKGLFTEKKGKRVGKLASKMA